MAAPTWGVETPPPDLPPKTARDKARGAARLTAGALVTLVAALLFGLGRAAQAVLGRDRVRAHYLIPRWWSRIVLRLLGLKLRRNGIPIKSGVLAANHVSWADIPVIRGAVHVNFVSKAEVRGWPVIGPIAALCETVFIERRRTETGRQNSALHARLVRGERLLIFPEGTSTDGLRVLPLKSALMAAIHAEGQGGEALVQPVTLNYRPGPGLPQAFHGWWGDMPLEGNMWDILCLSRGGEAEIVLHEPINPADHPDRKSLTRAVEARIRAGLAVTAPELADDA